ncbi:MAG: hypothetical protein AB7K37_13485 [Cyclobacteriaceae bacterium]
MSNISNLQSFEKLKEICTGLGGAYKPGNGNLQVKALATLMSKAETVMAEVNEAKSLYDIATNNRVAGFNNLARLTGQVCAQLKASGVSQLTLQDALSFNRKIRGWTTTKPRTEATIDGGESTSRPAFHFNKSFGSVANYFAGLVELVEKEPLYTPTETYLTVPGLKSTREEAQALNEAVTMAEVKLAQARRKRNHLLYEMAGSLYEVALGVKSYVRSIFGFGSPEHKELVRLKFTKPTRR